MKLLHHNNTVILAYSGHAPDWADISRAGKNGFDLIDVPFAEYLENDCLDDWDLSKGERTKERPAPKIDPVQELQSRESQILAELSRIDQASVRPMRAGEKDKLDELEALAVGKRKELSEVRKELPQTDTEGSTPWIMKQLN